MCFFIYHILGNWIGTAVLLAGNFVVAGTTLDYVLDEVGWQQIVQFREVFHGFALNRAPNIFEQGS